MLEKMVNDGIRLFLRFSLPCVETKVHEGIISEEDLDYFVRAALGDSSVSVDELRRVFDYAYRELVKLGRILNEDPFSLPVVNAYFIDYNNEGPFHNKVVDRDDAIPPSLKSYCKVLVGSVVDETFFNDIHWLRVRVNGKDRVVNGSLLDSVTIGDKVYVHQSYACEFVKND